MTPNLKEALELSQQYGIIAVVFFLMAFFLGGLIIYVLKQNERRENRYFDLVENKMASIEERTNERHEINQKALTSLAEADRRQREEHEVFLMNQKAGADQHQKISALLNELLMWVTK